jgi:hypothetical protein
MDDGPRVGQRVVVVGEGEGFISGLGPTGFHVQLQREPRGLTLECRPEEWGTRVRPIDMSTARTPIELTGNVGTRFEWTRPEICDDVARLREAYDALSLDVSRLRDEVAAVKRPPPISHATMPGDTVRTALLALRAFEAFADWHHPTGEKWSRLLRAMGALKDHLEWHTSDGEAGEFPAAQRKPNDPLPQGDPK